MIGKDDLYLPTGMTCCNYIITAIMKNTCFLILQLDIVLSLLLRAVYFCFYLISLLYLGEKDTKELLLQVVR